MGIDLGTTYSVVAVKLDGKVKVLPNLDTGKLLTPSVVSFKPNVRWRGVSGRVGGPVPEWLLPVVVGKGGRGAGANGINGRDGGGTLWRATAPSSAVHARTLVRREDGSLALSPDVIVGAGAERRRKDHAGLTFFNAKRFLGKGLSQLSYEIAHHPFKVGHPEVGGDLCSHPFKAMDIRR